jgi:Zn-dependent protease with chaperone function
VTGVPRYEHALVPASRERRQVAAVIDIGVFFALFLGVANIPPVHRALPGSAAWLLFVAFWFLLQVPAVALRGRTVGHLIASTRIVRARSSSPPGWKRALKRWVLIVPGVVANRFGETNQHDGWSETSVILDPVRFRRESAERDAEADKRWRTRALRLERLAREQPRRYRARVAVVAAGGYAFIIGLVAVQLGAAGAIVYAIVRGARGIGIYTWPILLVLYASMAIRSLWVGRSLPPGAVLEPRSAPALFALIEELRARLRAAPVHVLVIDPAVNAGLRQQPRLGPFGPYRNTLSLGLPLLQTLPVDELRAVVAHELAHLHHGHGRLGSWIYRLGQAYPELLARLEYEGWTAILVRLFFEKYTPYFEASTLALSRAHEYEADRLAAEAAGAETFAVALRRLELLNRRLAEEFWSSLGEPDAASGRPDLEAADGEVDDLLDSHPSTERRLAALGVGETPLPPVAASAAIVLLPGDLEQRLSSQLL